MSVRWAFFAFDWERFRQAAPLIRCAHETGDFSRIELDGADEALAALPENWTEEEAANALILMACGEGELVEFGGSFAERLLEIRREPEGEDFADLLGALMTAEPGMEDWFRPEAGLLGILDAESTRQLAEYAGSLGLPGRKPRQPRGIEAIARLFTPSETGQHSLEDLIRLIRTAAAAGMGLGVLRERT